MSWCPSVLPSQLKRMRLTEVDHCKARDPGEIARNRSLVGQMKTTVASPQRTVSAHTLRDPNHPRRRHDSRRA